MTTTEFGILFIWLGGFLMGAGTVGAFFVVAITRRARRDASRTGPRMERTKVRGKSTI
jgi:hypothetical protein